MDAPATDSRGSEMVLVVDDDVPVRDLVRRVLHERGYNVLAAASAVEAVELSQQQPGDIALLLADVVMPDMSGPALAGQLKRLRPSLKVLFISGANDETLQQHGLTAPDEMLLRKPFAPDVLAGRVREVLDG